MKLRRTLILTALALALNGVFVANAADEKPAKEEKAEKVQPAAKKAKRHDHATQSKQQSAGLGPDACCRKPGTANKPAHEHNDDKK